MLIGGLAFVVTLFKAANAVFAADKIDWTITGQISVTLDLRGAEDTLFCGMSPGGYPSHVVAIAPNPLPTPPVDLLGSEDQWASGKYLYYNCMVNGPEHVCWIPPRLVPLISLVYVEGDVGPSNTYFRVDDLQNLIVHDLPALVQVAGGLRHGGKERLT
ncbi:MAG TPA: hypothetical protein VI750_12385 [Pyrinomonadaceae bacterium]|nr:hypothetical protein [Pyrinomonadaceae bacterium]